LECRCKPLRENQHDILRLYDGFFETQEILLLEIDATVIEKATELRALFALKVSDAIHAATAILAGASEFWTADRDFSQCPDLRVELFDAV
jgi:predicted nucleic acid-binding protein